MTEQVTIPEAVRSSPQWERLYAAAADVFVGIQDICSYAKELATGDLLNLVAVMHHADQCELHEAVERTNDWLSARAEELRGVKAGVASLLADLALTEHASRHVVRYVEALELMLGGALEWNSGSNPRYTRIPRSGGP